MNLKSLFSAERLLLTLILLVVATALIFFAVQVRTDRVKDILDSGKPLSVLITLTQNKKPILNEVVIYSPQTRKTALVDLPPETGSLIRSLSRVDALSALFNPGHPKAYLDKIDELTGLTVPFALTMSVDQFQRQVDLLSGIELFIPSAIEDSQSDPMVMLPSGNLVLDGSKVKDYVTHSDDGEEAADRTARFQKIIQSLLRRWGDEQAFLSQDEVFSLFQSTLSTNMEDVGLKTFLKVASGADWERVVFQRVLGTYRVVDNQKLLFPHYNGALLLETVHHVLESLATEDAEEASNGAVSVEVLNGTTKPGLAGRTAQLIRNFGYQVVEAKNAETSSQAETIVIDHVGNPAQAQKLGDLIHCTKIESLAEPGSGGALLTVILGKDFDGRYVR